MTMYWTSELAFFDRVRNSCQRKKYIEHWNRIISKLKEHVMNVKHLKFYLSNWIFSPRTFLTNICETDMGLYLKAKKSAKMLSNHEIEGTTCSPISSSYLKFHILIELDVSLRGLRASISTRKVYRSCLFSKLKGHITSIKNLKIFYQFEFFCFSKQDNWYWRNVY